MTAVEPVAGILDTSTVVLLERVDADDLPAEPLITAVTLAELSLGPLVASDATERAARQARLQQAEADFDPLPFDAHAARAFGRVAASLRDAGRKVQARAYDAMIAATAIANGLPLYTVNSADFDGIPDLDLRRIAHPDQR
ncbi:MAG TPA: type II toxin-antitoxin system VapC family toxin [Egibacteraceae bacterium]|nr:type II toxin-antitoxin system VapC family toxin [Egibacteraceae bacterium]